MIKIENVDVYGFEASIRGMRSPMNSWDKSDSGWVSPRASNLFPTIYVVGSKDLDLMTRLRNAGTDHRKFMRMITVYLDIIAPLYFWKEFSTYKVGTVANSCSTMHKIHAKEFTLDDFSHEHMPDDHSDEFDFEIMGPDDVWSSKTILDLTIVALNTYRKKYLETKDKKYWWQMIQLLPSSYNQRRTVMLNYEVLANIYKSRRHHKLDEWHLFCDWIEGLPYSELITGKEKNDESI